MEYYYFRTLICNYSRYDPFKSTFVHDRVLLCLFGSDHKIFNTISDIKYNSTGEVYIIIVSRDWPCEEVQIPIPILHYCDPPIWLMNDPNELTKFNSTIDDPLKCFDLYVDKYAKIDVVAWHIFTLQLIIV